MSNLKPLVWFDNVATAAGRSYTIHETVSGQYYARIYNMMTQSSSDSAIYDTIEDVKWFAEFQHYIPKTTAEFLKPSPTWIDAKKQLPQVDVDTQFICSYDSAIEPFSKVAWFNADIGEFWYGHDSVLAWMPIPDFKESDCDL